MTPMVTTGNAVVPWTTSSTGSPGEITDYQDMSFGPNDDGSWPCGPDGVSGPVACTDSETGPQLAPLGFNINFYGTEYSGVYVNNNGNLTFDSPLSQFTPSALTTFGSPIIAPFFGDVDTRGGGNSVDLGQGVLDGYNVFVVDWPGVGCYDENDSVINNFQVILIDRSDLGTGAEGDDFEIEFNYNQIQWDTGEASGGDASCQNGPSGDSAYAGFSNGDSGSGDSFEIPGSGVPNSFLDSNTSTGLIYNQIDSTNSPNGSAAGRYVFDVEGGTSSTTAVTGQLTDTTSSASGTSIVASPGDSVTDQAALSGGNGAETGSVTYDVYSNSSCTGSPAFTDTESVTSGTAGASAAFTTSTTGTYYWQASYSGDGSNNPSTSLCGANVETVESPQPTTTATSLSDVNESGMSINAGIGEAVNDQATVSGTNSSSAGGTMTYDVYSTSDCSGSPVFSDIESVSDGVAGTSAAFTATATGTYYWQASYGGDSFNVSSASTCGSEVETVISPATTTTTTTLSDGTNSGANLAEPEDTDVWDTATLTGQYADESTGSVTYDVYTTSDCSGSPIFSDTEAVSNGQADSSAVFTATGAGTYYWQATYGGDGLNATSASTCGSEIETVSATASTSVTTSLSGGGQTGATITVPTSTAVTDTATLSGTNSGSATGSVTYDVYTTSDCSGSPKFSDTESVTSGSAAASAAFTATNAGTYYWQASYGGDGLNASSASTCGAEVETVVAPSTTTVSTSLSGGGKSGATITVPTSTAVSDQATLSGTNAASATGSVTYDAYTTSNCSGSPKFSDTESVTGGSAGASAAFTATNAGTYYWQASYTGDTFNNAGASTCGAEVETVIAPSATTVSTSLSGGGKTGATITVPTSTAVSDQATLSGTNSGSATGSVTYDVYTTSDCSGSPKFSDTESVTSGSAGASAAFTAATAGTYYWQASYTGDTFNDSGASTCGAEVETVVAPSTTTVSTSLSGGGKSGATITVPTSTAVSDQATLSGTNAASATGSVTYDAYTTSDCSGSPKFSNTKSVTSGSAAASAAFTAATAGTYYWQASYTGDTFNNSAASTCGAEIETVTAAPSATPAPDGSASTAWHRRHATAKLSTHKPGDLLVAFVTVDGHHAATVTGGGFTWTLAVSEKTAPGEVEAWDARATGTLSNTPIKVSLGHSKHHVIVRVLAFKDASGVGATGSNADTSAGTPSGQVRTTADGSLVYAVGDYIRAHRHGPVGSLAAVTGQTILGRAKHHVTAWWQTTESSIATAGTTVTIGDRSPTNVKFNLALVEIT